jgi:hypothetical protein
MGRDQSRSIWAVAVLALIVASAPDVSAEPWKRSYVDALPDEAFAVVRVRPDGRRARHLPHHNAEGRVDLLHLRSALARLSQVHWEDPADVEEARRHLRAHAEALGLGQPRRRPSTEPVHR